MPRPKLSAEKHRVKISITLSAKVLGALRAQNENLSREIERLIRLGLQKEKAG